MIGKLHRCKLQTNAGRKMLNTEKYQKQNKNTGAQIEEQLPFDHVTGSALDAQGVMMLDCDVDDYVTHPAANFHALDLCTFDLDGDLKTK